MSVLTSRVLNGSNRHHFDVRVFLVWPVLALWRIWERSYMVVSSGQFAVVVAPVLQIMHELLELCLSSALPLSIEHMKVDSR